MKENRLGVSRIRDIAANLLLKYGVTESNVDTWDSVGDWPSRWAMSRGVPDVSWLRLWVFTA